MPPPTPKAYQQHSKHSRCTAHNALDVIVLKDMDVFVSSSAWICEVHGGFIMSPAAFKAVATDPDTPTFDVDKWIEAATKEHGSEWVFLKQRPRSYQKLCRCPFLGNVTRSCKSIETATKMLTIFTSLLIASIASIHELNLTIRKRHLIQMPLMLAIGLSFPQVRRKHCRRWYHMNGDTEWWPLASLMQITRDARQLVAHIPACSTSSTRCRYDSAAIGRTRLKRPPPVLIIAQWGP